MRAKHKNLSTAWSKNTTLIIENGWNPYGWSLKTQQNVKTTIKWHLCKVQCRKNKTGQLNTSFSENKSMHSIVKIMHLWLVFFLIVTYLLLSSKACMFLMYSCLFTTLTYYTTHLSVWVCTGDSGQSRGSISVRRRILQQEVLLIILFNRRLTREKHELFINYSQN